MRLDASRPRDRRAAKALHALKAAFLAKPKKARRAARRAAREFDRLHPRGG